MWTLRIILILVGIAALIVLYFYMRRHPPQPKRDREQAPRIDPEWRMPGDEKHMPSLSNSASEHLPEARANENAPHPDGQPATFVAASESGRGVPSESTPPPSNQTCDDDIFTLAVTFAGKGVAAPAMLRMFARLDCTLGQDGIYHFEDDHKQTLYSVANLFEPGVLHPLSETESLRGLIFFFSSPPDRDDGHVFEQMLGAAHDTAKSLGGKVQDGQHRPLTAARELELKLAASRHG